MKSGAVTPIYGRERGDTMKDRSIKVQTQCGALWFAGWLFTLGMLKLGFWKGVVAIVVWPYFIGTWVAALGG